MRGAKPYPGKKLGRAALLQLLNTGLFAFRRHKAHTPVITYCICYIVTVMVAFDLTGNERHAMLINTFCETL